MVPSFNQPGILKAETNSVASDSTAVVRAEPVALWDAARLIFLSQGVW